MPQPLANPDSKRTSLSETDSYSQHVVTAVIVAHDGAAWLPRLIEALGEQTRPVQRVVAVDTGSRDRSGSVLAAQLGQGAVFGMDRATGYAAAVRRAVQHKAANAPVAASVGRGRGDRSDPVEWLWLLHDDCEPAPDALEQLLRGATETPQAAVLGPKLRDWSDRDVIVEAGLTIDTAGRRVTTVESREVDQGQHDGDRDVLAVCSAGMLVRRQVWDRLGGFDPGMALFDEDIDFCWRVHEAGFRVRVITEAIVYHVRAATRGRRAVSVGRRPRMLDRRNGLLTLLGNLPGAPMLACMVGNLALSLLRTMYYLVAKQPSAALDESAAVLGVVGHPLRFAKTRRLRAAGRRAAYGAVRADLPPGRSIRRIAELVVTLLAKPGSDDLAGAHHASDDPTDDESLLVDSGFLQRLLTRPAVLLVLGLIVVTIAAERSVITSGTLAGGALLPAWQGASGLWSQFFQAYHPIGIGSATFGPPYLGVIAVLATVLLGKAWLAVDVLLLGCVPLAGLAAYLSLRWVTTSVRVRVVTAAAYALLPIAFGAVSAGRLGSAVGFVLIPVIGMLAARMVGQPAKVARRAAWATGFTVTIAASFVPVLWLLVVAAALLAALTLRRSVLLTNLAIVVLTPVALLLPWLLPQLEHPTSLLLEVGVKQPGLAIADLPAKSLLLLSPGGPGLPPYWTSAALLVIGLVALVTSRRLALVTAGWCVALLGFVAAMIASRVTVTQAGSQSVTPWPGVALAVAAAGVLLAGAAAFDDLLSARAVHEPDEPDLAAQPERAGRLAGRARRAGRVGRAGSGAGRKVAVAALAVVACSAPALAGGWWLVNGVQGPVGPASGPVVPSLISTAAGVGRQLRTLVLASSGGQISYLLLRETSPEFSYPDVTPVPAAQAALSRSVAALVAPDGSETANQSNQLAAFDIGFVLMRAPIDPNVASALDTVPGLTQVSITSAFDLWRITSLPSRISVVEPNGTVVAVASGPVGASAKVPAAGGTLLLAEPTGGWSAAVNGRGLAPVRSPAGSWAQAFRLPPGGGTLTISRNALWHELLMALEIIIFLIVAGLALPGIRTEAEIAAAGAAVAPADKDAEDEELETVGAGAGTGRRSHGGRDGRARSRVSGAVGRTGRVAAAGRAAVTESAAAGRAAAVGRAAAAARAGAASRAGRGLAALHGRSDDATRTPDAAENAFGPGMSGADSLPDEMPAGRRRTAGVQRPTPGAAGPIPTATEVFAAAESDRRETGRFGVRRPPVPGRQLGPSGGPGEARVPGAPVSAGSVPSGAAWPAAAPDSPFLDGPSASSRYQDPPGARPHSDARRPESGRAGLPARSPSGTPFDEPANGPDLADSRGGYPVLPAGPRSGYGPRYEAPGNDAPAYASPPSGYPRPGRGDPADTDYPARPSPARRAGRAGAHSRRRRSGLPDDVVGEVRSGYPDDPPRPGQSGYRDDPPRSGRSGYPDDAPRAGRSGYPDSVAPGGRPGYPEGAGYGGTGYPDEPRYRPEPPATDFRESRDSGRHWTGDSRPSGWPADHRQDGWPEDYSQGWPQPGGPPPARRGPGQPRQADEFDPPGLEPQAGELHHDGRGRRGRSAQGWPAPDGDDEGETW